MTSGDYIAIHALTVRSNFADVFKTPGKLRGKTPRTARKQNALAPRQPLTDIFAPNTQMVPPSTHKNAFYDKVAHFQVAEDQENYRPASRSKSPQRSGKPGNIDSGYHGMTDDEMDVDTRTEVTTQPSQQSAAQTVLVREDQAPVQRIDTDVAEIGTTSDESFLSAKEDLSSRNASHEQLREHPKNNGPAVADVEVVDTAAEMSREDPPIYIAAQDSEMEPMDQDMDDHESPQTPSDTSSPEKPLQRKSSFNFTSLPAREPLTAKRSIGVRESQHDVQPDRNDVLARSFGAEKSMSVPMNDEDVDMQSQSKPEEAKLHNKTSTQLLHERITMLGKSKKSIPAVVPSSQAIYPQLPVADVETGPASQILSKSTATVDDEDDWIATSKPRATEQEATAAPERTRPAMHQKSISTTNIPSPRPDLPTNSGHLKAASVSNLSLAHAAGIAQSTTPAGSPAHKKHDGPLSASKSRLWSALKSAKNIFASSASASAAAKLEAHSNSPAAVHRSPKRDISGDSKMAAVYNMPGAMYSNMSVAPSMESTHSVKTTNSVEIDRKREKEARVQQKAADELEKAREKEKRTAAKQQEQQVKAEQAAAAKKEKELKKTAAQEERPPSADSGKSQEEKQALKSMTSAGKLRAPARLMRPFKHDQPASKPAPVSIRVTSQSQRLGQGSSALNRSQHESMAPPPPPKSNLRTASAAGNVRSSTAPNNARVKALETAARKKEADEKAAQKKLEQKRELDRKRAAKAEEERRAEEDRRAAEQQRVQEAKLAVQRKAEQQAVEARRREQQRYEQQRQQEEAQRARAAHELADVIKRERAQQAPQPRGDVGGTLRQLVEKSAVADHSGRAPIQVNPAKPPKRMFPHEDDGAQQGSQRPGLVRGPPSYQNNDAKRRRTNEEEEEPDQRHSVMAPPKRPSNMRMVRHESRNTQCSEADISPQENTLSKFPHGYTHAPAATSHHASNMYKATITAQHQMQHSSKPTHPTQTVQMSNARIPFAENVNPPAQYHGYQQPHPGHENAQTNKFKTPARPAQAPRPPKSAKSSPLYPNGDAIQLPEIQTDSEDEDSEDEATGGGFRAPSWVESPALKDLLTQQQLLDPEKVFGPIPELRMEEVFKGGKNPERLKRFRERGSSARWVESGDAVTSAEKRRDMEGRERVVRDGGWRFEPSR